MVGLLEQEIKNRLISRLPHFKKQSDLYRGDDFLDDIRELMNALGIAAGVIFKDVEAMAFLFADKISNFNRGQYRRIINATLGVDPISNDDWLRAQLKLFAQENATLIKSIPETMLKDVEGVVYRGLQGGATIRDMEKDISDKFGVSRRKARLIARDQTGKLNSALTEIRQKRVGIEEYIWNDASDERVRDSHKALDGKICRWDDPTVYRNPGEAEWRKRSSIGGVEKHPGAEIQCRCWAEPIMEDLINAQ